MLKLHAEKGQFGLRRNQGEDSAIKGCNVREMYTR